MKLVISICVLFGMLSCSEVNKKQDALVQNGIVKDTLLKTDSILERKGLVVYGDFDGDKSIDTLREENILKDRPIKLSDYISNKWDRTAESLGDVNNPYVILVSSNPNIDTLHVGPGIQLECLINMGDNDLDGRDEVAYVNKNSRLPHGVKYTDTAIANDCHIAKLIGNKWREIKSFRIDGCVLKKEGCIFYDIPGFLEKHNGVWMYMDYTRSLEDTTGKYKVMRKLKL